MWSEPIGPCACVTLPLPAQKPAVCDLRIAALLSAHVHVPVPPAQGTQIGLVPVPYMHLASSITYCSVAAPCPLAAPLPDSVLTLVNLSG